MEKTPVFLPESDFAAGAMAANSIKWLLMKPRARLALSTCWLSQRHTDGLAMLREVADMGFEYVELGHGIALPLVPGILEALDMGVIKVSSTHNFCPLPPGVAQPSPNYYEPSGSLKSGREQWVRHTLNSIAFAKRVGADRMVAHMGSLHFFLGDPSRNLTAAAKGKTQAELEADSRFAKQRNALLKKMRRAAPRYYDRIHACLEAVKDAAEQAGLRLGLENRDGVLELPLDEDTADFFDLMKDLPFVGSWHDAGHSRIKERLGLAKVSDLLEATDANRIGFHLHNVSEQGKDHNGLLLENGTVDFSLIQKHIRPDHVVVLEFSQRVSRQEVEASRQFAQQLIDEAP